LLCFAPGWGVLFGLILALAGGGVLTVPLLIFGLQMRVSDATPVALFAVGISSALGAAMGLRSGFDGGTGILSARRQGAGFRRASGAHRALLIRRRGACAGHRRAHGPQAEPGWLPDGSRPCSASAAAL